MANIRIEDGLRMQVGVGRVAGAWLMAVAASLLAVSPAYADGDPKPSQYAPAEDLVKYARNLADQIANDLSDGSQYEDEQIGRVRMRAHTLAAVLMTLACHDADHPLKGVADQAVELASKLASDADEFADAKSSLDRLRKTIMEDGPTKAEPREWDAIADIAELMKAVPIINNSLRRGIQSRRFERSADRTAMYAAALAAVAQASSVDDSYCGDEEDFAKWKRLCAEMRDGAAEAAAAVRAGDQERAKKAAARIVKTCDACHEDFR